MKITENIERECCQFKDLIPIQGSPAIGTNAKFMSCKFCGKIFRFQRGQESAFEYFPWTTPWQMDALLELKQNQITRLIQEIQKFEPSQKIDTPQGLIQQPPIPPFEEAKEKRKRYIQHAIYIGEHLGAIEA